MARELPKTDSGSDMIQFRGRQTSVVLDDFGIQFGMTVKETPEGGFRMHEPLPVASEEAIREGEAPANAVAEEVAEQITNGDISNPLVCYGVVCEHPTEDGICGKTFETVKSLNGHLSSHYGNERDADSSDSGDNSGDNE